MRDQDWKDVRSSTTPAFTTGKIKRVSLSSRRYYVLNTFEKSNLLFKMSHMIKECADRLAVKFEKIAETEGKFDAKMYSKLHLIICKLLNITKSLLFEQAF